MKFIEVCLLLIYGFQINKIYCFYDISDNVVEITDNTFNDKVLNSNNLWIVEFYAPWCGHCQTLAPEYKKASNAMKGIVKFGAIDCDTHKSLPGQYGIKGFPTLKIFHKDLKQPIDYNGPRTAQGFTEEALRTLKKVVDMRLSGGGSSRSKKDSGSDGDTKDVIELTDSNFEKLVFEDTSGDMWLVEFFAPWCGHCKSLAPEWARAATVLKGKPVKLATVDATVQTQIAAKYQISGYPTIKVFNPTGHGSVEPEEYNGGRRESDIVNWVNEQLEDRAPAPEVLQIINEDILRDTCDKNKLCIISFLPHILDCNADCRNKYLHTLKEVSEENKKKLLGWLWAESGQQSDLEAALDIGGFGYPAMAAVNSKKKMFTTLKGPFSESGIKEFIRNINYGKAGALAPVKDKFNNVKEISPWDGQDGKLEEEEEIVFKAGKEEL